MPDELNRTARDQIAPPERGDGTQASDEFEKASEERQIGLVREFAEFLSENAKWWLLPIVLVLLVFGAAVLFSGTAAAPFIYTLF